jgi:hypothetical protein
MFKAARQRAREKEILAQNLLSAAQDIDGRINAINHDLEQMRKTSERLLQMWRELRSDGSNV